MSVRWSKTASDHASIVKAASEGFNCVELTVGHVMDISDEEFVLHKNLLLQHGLVAEACTSILPSDVVVTEKGFNLYVWMEYLKKAMHRLSELGCRKLVWSNGRARVLPWEGDIGEMKEQVLQFLHMLCELSGNYGITVLVEPLGPRRTNYLNSMEDINDFVPLIRKDNLASVISLRELAEISLMPERLSDFPQLIKHVYLENPLHTNGNKVSPRPGDDYNYRPFLSALNRIHYDGIISLPDDADSESLRYCQKLWFE